MSSNSALAVRNEDSTGENSDASDDSNTKTMVYNIKFFFRGKRTAEECEPPDDLIYDFLDMVANGILHVGWDNSTNANVKHNHCTDECSIETCLVFGWPYSISVRESLEA